MDIGERMKQRRKQLKLSADEVAEKIGVSRSNVYRYEKGDIEKLPVEIIEPLSEVLKTTPQYLMGWDSGKDISPIYEQLERPRQTKVYNYAEHQLDEQNRLHTIKVVGKTAAGSGLTYGDGDVEEREVKTVPQGAEAALNVQGDSMEPLIHDGDIIFYKRQADVENGELAVVELHGHEVTTKKVRFDYENKNIILESINDDYDDMTFNDNEVRILGKVLL